MPQPSPQDIQAQEDQAWRSFTRRLGDHLAAQWPAMPERLGERYDAFIDLAVQQAEKRGLGHAASVARYVNLWFVWGPAFHDKPGFEWALGILAAPRSREWLTVHQLVQRSQLELQRLPDSRIDARALVDADNRVVDVFGPLGRQGRMLRPEAAALPRAACDLEAAELRLLDDGGHQEYVLSAGDDWQRVPVPLPAPLRIGAAHPAPPLVALLSQQPGQGAQARLQVRLRAHAVCNGDHHPAIDFAGSHGLWHWAGHETRAVSWAVPTLNQPDPPAGAGTAIGEETSPDIHRLALEVCGLRDEGEPVGSLQTQVWAWPAAQWWLELQRSTPQAQALLPGGRPWQRGSTRCRVERDGAALEGAPLSKQFEDGLDAACAAGLRQLGEAWQKLPGLGSAGLESTLGVLVGQAAFSWGWRASKLDERALMRVVGLLAMQACQADLQLSGEFSLAGTRTKLRLHAAGKAPLQLRVQREAALPPLLEALQPAKASFQFPFELTIEPIASEQGGLLQVAGAVLGALVGEAGLRPRTSGGSGWEWFAALRIEPVSVPLELSDPLLGTTRLVQPLLPALTLVDWSLG